MIAIKANLATPINIGHQGENDARCVQFDLSEFQTEFPSGIPLLIVQRPNDTTIYPVALEIDGITAIWTVTATETEYTGLGKCVLQWSVDDVIVKSCMYITMVAPSLTLDAGTAPDEPGKSWYEHILSEIGNLDNLTTKSKDNLVNAINEAAKTGSGSGGGTVEMRVSDGYIQYGDGTTWNNLIALSELKGTDGHTPEITAVKTDKTTTISVDGKAVVEIKDGENGTDGDDGFSPTATVSKTGTVTTVKITDKSGTTTAEIKDGEPGTDGTSVTISKISESTADGGENVVTFNDGKTLTVKNGNKGSDGVTPSLSIGTVETLAAGSDATASITGTDENPVLNLGIPKGADGSGGGSSGVTSFNGRSGAVTPKSGDYTADMVGADSSGSAAAVQGNLDSHTGDTVVHVTASERTTWNGKSGKAVSFTVTLTASGWSSNAQTVSDSRFLASGYAYTVRPAGDSFTDYVEAVIYADNIDTDGKVTFHCDTTPTADLTVNILRTEVTA